MKSTCQEVLALIFLSLVIQGVSLKKPLSLLFGLWSHVIYVLQGNGATQEDIDYALSKISLYQVEVAIFAAGNTNLTDNVVLTQADGIAQTVANNMRALGVRINLFAIMHM